MKKSTAISQIIIVITIVVFILLISTKFYFRLDFTEDKRYTLGEATTDILKDLDDVITVKAYFTEEMPQQLMKVRNDFEDLLKEYEDRSGGNIVYEFINPNESEEKEQEVQQKGIVPLTVDSREKDQRKILRAYMGVVLTYV